MTSTGNVRLGVRPNVRRGVRTWTDSRVLLTGASGFLGGWLLSLLRARGAEVVALVRDHVGHWQLWPASRVDEVTCVRGSLEDIGLLERVLNEHEVDTVIHVGAQAIVPLANRSPLSTFEANIRGTYNLMEACRRSPWVEAVVVASSDKAYGEQEIVPTPEDAPLLARHPYDVSKACADMIALSYAATYDLPVCVTRCGNLYGPGDRNWSRIVPGTIRSVLRGERPVIRSDGTPVRDYLYVGDAAIAYLAVAEGIRAGLARGEAFNVSDESPVSVVALVSEILEIAGLEVEPIVEATARAEISRQYLSAAKIRRVLGWKPSVTRSEGLRRSVEWYRALLERGVVETPALE